MALLHTYQTHSIKHIYKPLDWPAPPCTLSTILDTRNHSFPWVLMYWMEEGEQQHIFKMHWIAVLFQASVIKHSQTIVNRREWLWNSSKFFIVCYCSGFWPWPCTKQNSCLLQTQELTNRKVLVMWFMHSVWARVKQKIVQGRGPSNINLVVFVCSFDVCRAS